MSSHEHLLALVSEIAALEDEERRHTWGVALRIEFETVPGDVRFCVRRRDVVVHMAKALSVPVVNNGFFHDVERVARELGWQPVKNGGRSLFRCVKRKDQTVDEALVVSRANRHDPRSRRPELGLKPLT